MDKKKCGCCRDWAETDGGTWYSTVDRTECCAPALGTALEALLERYVQLVVCGDCGNWDPETEEEVILSRAALAEYKALNV